MSPSVVPLEPWHKVQREERKERKEREGSKYFRTYSRTPCISNRLELVGYTKAAGGPEEDKSYRT